MAVNEGTECFGLSASVAVEAGTAQAWPHSLRTGSTARGSVAEQ